MGKEQLGSPVGEAFVVKGRVHVLGTVLASVGGIVAVIAGIAVAAGHLNRVVTGVAAAAGLLALAQGIILLVTKRKRWRVALFENGAMVQTMKSPPVELVFAELAAISHQPIPRYGNGVYVGIQHILRFWREQDSAKQPFVEIDCYVAQKKNQGEIEGMQAFGEVASNAISDRLMAVVDSGGTVKSPSGLQVNANGLRYQGASIAMGEIEEIGLFDGLFCIWKKGEEFPLFKLDPASPNVVPIMNVVSRKMEEREEQQEEERSESLGRVLFERSPSKGLGWVLVIIGLPLCVVLVGIFVVRLGRSLIKGYFRCHERGVSQRGTGKEKRLFYHQVASFTYSATRMYVNGSYTGTSLSMKFVADDPEALPTIKYNTTVKNVDEDLDELRTHISSVVARRLLREYADSGSFVWTSSLEVTSEGIRYRKPKLIGKGEWELLPFERYVGMDVQEGTFHIFSQDAEKSVYHCSVSEANFFPGLHAFLIIVEPQEDEDEVLEEDQPEEQ